MMTNSQSPKTLLLIIRKIWLVDSITSLGSGYFTHLSYKNEEIEPEVLDDINNNRFGENVLGEIFFIDQQGIRLIAEMEVSEVNNFNTFVRFDLRLLEVSPYIREKFKDLTTSYNCFYRKNPG